jgi:sugar lactone lactonase YvrE
MILLAAITLVLPEAVFIDFQAVSAHSAGIFMKASFKVVAALVCVSTLFSFPARALGPDFVLYLADANTGAIKKFNSAGQGSPFGSVGFANPVGLAVDGGGNLFVANRSGGVSGTIDRFTPGGTRTLFSSDMNFPSKLAFGLDGGLYAGMVGNNTVRKFNALGQGTTFASSGLSGPIPLAFDHSGNLYVGNMNNNTITKFGLNGQPTFFANSGAAPYGMTCDNADNLYVVNFGDNDILKYDPAGNASLFADLSDGLNAPVDIVFDGSGNLLVLNLGNNTIQRYDLAGNGSLFANTGMDHPESMAIRLVPEPVSGSLLLLAGGILLGRRRTSR